MGETPVQGEIGWRFTVAFFVLEKQHGKKYRQRITIENEQLIIKKIAYNCANIRVSGYFMSDSDLTEPKVFIIESLDFKDEEKKLFEGHIISDILRLSKIETKYYYVRTRKEFEKVVGLFYDSNYRYLHISCHGGENKDTIWTTIDEISFSELGEILEPNLYHKRLFLSACSVVNKKLAEQVIPKTQCYSIIGPKNDIAFRDAAIMWASFYHLMFNKNAKKMLREGLIENLQKVVNAFGQPLNYYSISKSKGFKNDIIKPNIIQADLQSEEKNIR